MRCRERSEMNRINRMAARKGWSDEKKELFIKTLGTIVDRVSAETFGVTNSFVFACRRDAGIARFKKVKTPKVKKEKKQFLPDALIEKLGTIPDAHLAKEFGVGSTTVTRARSERGIPNNKSGVDLGILNLIRELIKQRGMSDIEIARSFGVSGYIVKRERDRLGLEIFDKSAASKPEILPLLGTMTDADLGRKFGLSRGAISDLRNKKGIPIFCPAGWKRPPLKKSLDKSWVWIKKVK